MFEKQKEFFKSMLGGSSSAEVMLADPQTKSEIFKEFESIIVSDMKERFAERREQRNLLELTWRLAINFYNGDQFSEINPFMNDISDIPLFSEFEERKVFNEVAANVEARLAVLAKHKNNLKNRPASTSSEDRTAAMIGNKVLASTKRRLNMAELQSEANLLAALTGSAVFKTYWDASAGMVVGIAETVLDDEDTENTPLIALEKEFLGMAPEKAVRMIHEGEVVTSLHSPFEIYPENVSVPIRNQRRVMHVVLLSPDEVFDKWGVTERGADNETFKILSDDERRYGGGISGRMYGRTLGITKVRNTVKVIEEWELPSARYPKGRLIICTDERLLHYGPIPDAMGENGEYMLPFDVQQSMRTDGFFGRSVVDRLLPIQQNINDLNNRIQDYMNRIAIGIVTVEEGAIDADYYRENGLAPGDIVEHRLGSNAPRYMDPPRLPENIFGHLKNLEQQLDRLSGVSQLIKQSMTPTGVTSGVGIAAIAEQDDTRIGLEAENIKNCLINIGRKWLVLYKNNVEYKRIVKDIGKGEEGEYEVNQFVGNDLTSFDVFVETEPEASDTLSQRRQKVIELLNSGLFNDPETGRISKAGQIKVFEMLQLGDWESFIDSDNNQQARAVRECNAMAVMEPAVIKDFDDDMLHITIHNDFRLRAEYEETVKKTPEVEALFEEHVQSHLMQLQEKTAAEQEMNNRPQAINLEEGFGEQEV
jgi:hypothetical protein